ncbi:MAG: Fic family protein [Myxococcaceae bacterium]|nr:Fic family protein [Myxococcaceae bacterium]
MHRYQWNTSLEARLQQATERMSQLRQATLPAAAVQSVRHWFRVHHTYHSNAIEGNRLTLPETRAVLEDGITIQGKSLKDHLEAVNLAQALDFIESLAKAETPLGEQDVRAIHTLVLRGIEPENAGAYRHINVRISGTEHIPPDALHVPERMREFGAWLASDKPEHPIVVSAIAHAWFETIHPFVDGNGRTGRLLANLLLMRQGYPAMVLRVQERARYYAALDTSHSGDLTPMVELTLDCVEQSLTEYERAAREAFEVQEPAIEYLAQRLGAPKETKAPPEFVRWKLAIEELHGAVRHMAEQISAQLSQPASEIELMVSDLPSIHHSLWRLASSQSISLFRCQGRTQVGRVMASLDAYPALEPWWTSKMPYLRLNIRDEPRGSPERFFAAMPDEHLFTVLYAKDASRPELAPEFLPPSLVLPSGVTLKEKVSAQQIAVDIWRHLVENYLT